MGRQRQWRADVDEEVLDKFADTVQRIGQTQREATERLMRFFVACDPDVQAMMLETLTPARRAMLARAILREMAKR